MPVAEAARHSDQEYRLWITRFASRVLIFVAGSVLIVSGALLAGEIDLRAVAVLAGCALLVGLMVRLVAWHQIAPAWFLIPTCLTGCIVLFLLRLSGGIASPFRLMPVAVLFFTVAYFEGAWLWAGTVTVIAGAVLGLVGINRQWANSHRFVEALCLILLAVISARTIQVLRKQQRKISQLNEHIQQQRLALVNAAKTQAMMELAGGVAHELNQPLTVLLAESERLQRASEISPELSDSLAACFSQAQRAAKIVQRLQQLTIYTPTPYVDGVTISPVAESGPPLSTLPEKS